MNGVPDEHVQVAIRTARLSNDLAQLPQGLDTVVGERGATLSGGQKQRTGIARALVRDPRVLVLDDSLASVDTQTSAEIVGELNAASASRTSLVVSQRLAAVRDADQIVVLDEGASSSAAPTRACCSWMDCYAAMYRRELQQAEGRRPTTDSRQPTSRRSTIEDRRIREASGESGTNASVIEIVLNPDFDT